MSRLDDGMQQPRFIAAAAIQSSAAPCLAGPLCLSRRTQQLCDLYNRVAFSLQRTYMRRGPGKTSIRLQEDDVHLVVYKC